MPHISYSEFRNWCECPWRHKLVYVDKVQKDQGNEYTAFGTAIHDTVEKMLVENIENYSEVFEARFLEVLAEIGVKTSPISDEMIIQGRAILPEVIPSMNEYFADKGGWSVVSAEEEINHPITECKVQDYNFKGYIDLVLKDGEGQHHIIDWKTCTWGWDASKKSDNLYGRQLVFYKHYYSKKLSIDPRTISTHFGLLKRTAKKNRVEIFKVTSGEKKTLNSLDVLDKALYNIQNKVFLKNRLSCTYCPFKGTEHCT